MDLQQKRNLRLAVAAAAAVTIGCGALFVLVSKWRQRRENSPLPPPVGTAGQQNNVESSNGVAAQDLPHTSRDERHAAQQHSAPHASSPVLSPQYDSAKEVDTTLPPPSSSEPEAVAVPEHGPVLSRSPSPTLGTSPTGNAEHVEAASLQESSRLLPHLPAEMPHVDSPARVLDEQDQSRQASDDSARVDVPHSDTADNAPDESAPPSMCAFRTLLRLPSPPALKRRLFTAPSSPSTVGASPSRAADSACPSTGVGAWHVFGLTIPEASELCPRDVQHPDVFVEIRQFEFRGDQDCIVTLSVEELDCLEDDLTVDSFESCCMSAMSPFVQSEHVRCISREPASAITTSIFSSFSEYLVDAAAAPEEDVVVTVLAFSAVRGTLGFRLMLAGDCSNDEAREVFFGLVEGAKWREADVLPKTSRCCIRHFLPMHAQGHSIAVSVPLRFIAAFTDEQETALCFREKHNPGRWFSLGEKAPRGLESKYVTKVESRIFGWSPDEKFRKKIPVIQTRVVPLGAYLPTVSSATVVFPLPRCSSFEAVVTELRFGGSLFHVWLKRRCADEGLDRSDEASPSSGEQHRGCQRSSLHCEMILSLVWCTSEADLFGGVQHIMSDAVHVSRWSAGNTDEGEGRQVISFCSDSTANPQCSPTLLFVDTYSVGGSDCWVNVEWVVEPCPFSPSFPDELSEYRDTLLRTMVVNVPKS